VIRHDDNIVNRHAVRRLLRYAKPYAPIFAIVLLLSLCSVALQLYQPELLAQAADAIKEGRLEGREMIILGLKYLASVLLIFGLTYFQISTLAATGQKIVYNVRTDIFRHLTTLHIGFFNENPIGRLVTRVTNDCETINEMFTSVIVNVVSSGFVLIGIVAVMLNKHAALSMAIFAVVPFIVLSTFVFTSVTRKLYRAVRAKISELNGFVAEHVNGMKLVQMFTAEEDSERDFQAHSEALRKAHMRQIRAFALFSPTQYVFNIIAMAILLVYGGNLVMAGAVTIGTLVAFQRYMVKFFDPIQELAENFNVVQSAAAAAERIFWVLDTKPAIEDDSKAVAMDSFKGRIEFRNVWFAYRRDEWVLKDVSFTVEPGQRFAFVGETGAGKTTIQSLICRYYDIQKGQILIDGVDVRSIRLADLRRNIGQMLQDVFLFSGDVKGNIRLNEDDISDEAIVAAAKYVNAHGFISKLDGGYEHEVIERGAAFSAGQRQLLSFARTLAFKPSVLILDEATANIDTETEALIQDALGKLMIGRTTIIVAHRLSTIQNCDRIIVLSKGEIIEEGNHQELLAKRGAYYRLYRLQYENSSDSDAEIA